MAQSSIKYFFYYFDNVNVLCKQQVLFIHTESKHNLEGFPGNEFNWYLFNIKIIINFFLHHKNLQQKDLDGDENQHIMSKSCIRALRSSCAREPAFVIISLMWNQPSSFSIDVNNLNFFHIYLFLIHLFLISFFFLFLFMLKLLRATA